MDGNKTVDGAVGNCCGSIVLDRPEVVVTKREDMAEKEVRHVIENKLAAFVDTIGTTLYGVLELDGYIDDAAKKSHTFPSGLVDAPEGFKIDNVRLEASVIVPVDVILDNDIYTLINALKSFEFIKVHGVTRIVGYYSRVSNWNRSKIGELRDRQKGNYGVRPTSVDIHTER